MSGLRRWLARNSSLPVASYVSVGDRYGVALMGTSPADNGLKAAQIRLEVLSDSFFQRLGGRSASLTATIDCIGRQARPREMTVFPGSDLKGEPEGMMFQNRWIGAGEGAYLDDIIKAACDPTFKGPFAGAQVASADDDKPPVLRRLEGQQQAGAATAPPAVAAAPAPAPAPPPAAPAAAAPIRTARLAETPGAATPQLKVAVATPAPPPAPAAAPAPARPAPKPQVVAVAPKPPAPTAPPAAAPTPTAGGFAVQLGAYPTMALVDQAWKGLAGKAMLQGKPRQVQTVAADGKTFYRLMVAGFGARGAAADFCADLKRAGQDCLVRAL